MVTAAEDEKILFDSDVFRHFLYGNQLDLLPQIYHDRIVFLDIVVTEIKKSPQLVKQINNFIKTHNIQVMRFPTEDFVILREYSNLNKLFGPGESACMALAKHREHFIASSNLRDIKKYCLDNNITFLTTMDILTEAYYMDKISKSDCDKFIQDVLSRGSKLPVKNIQDYIDKYLNRS